MIANIATGVAAVVLVNGLFAGLYIWFYLSERRLAGEAASHVLATWDARLAPLSPRERAELGAQPPLEVLEALFALPAGRGLSSYS
jgi:hypothetical protein